MLFIEWKWHYLARAAHRFFINRFTWVKRKTDKGEGVMERIIINILSDHLAHTKSFFVNLFDLKVDFDSDWFINLVNDSININIGILKRDSEFIPKDYQKNVSGIMITFVVDDVELYYKKAQQFGFKIIQEPTNLPYGQRRLLLEEPSGALIDISSPY